MACMLIYIIYNEKYPKLSKYHFLLKQATEFNITESISRWEKSIGTHDWDSCEINESHCLTCF